MKNQEYFEINKQGKLVNSKRISKKIQKRLVDFNAINIGFYLLVPIVSGVFLGVYIDSKFHTNKVSIYIGIIIGTIASFYNLFTLIKNNA